ncbi:hypothetical protein [Jeotgalibacillus soli]|uniref:Uncharacterized protein n=1 Tax=Jeotgalibacillus soli TaxID=889306 RepID=A0A0C2RH41_9BACL|nr:hypothetical protein [Jeotgalibacillus soli]KIL49480.1 hypothetical protein KP78_09480 [Jeotgalibacillus soli]
MIGFLLSTIFFRYGLIGGVTSIALVVIIVTVSGIRTSIFEWLLDIKQSQLSLNPVSIVFLALITIFAIWIILKRAPIIPGVAR